MMLRQRQPRVKDDKHRRFVAELACCVCGITGRTQSSHIRTGNNSGMGYKSGDNCVLPLCIECHRTQHSTSEKLFWGEKLERANALANALFLQTGNRGAAETLLVRFRK